MSHMMSRMTLIHRNIEGQIRQHCTHYMYIHITFGLIFLLCCRLYYLLQGQKHTFITEESIMKFLYWYSPFLSGLVMTLHIIENFVQFPGNPILFCYSFCKKSSFPSDFTDVNFIFKIFVIMIMTPSLIGEMCIHIAVLVKQTKIENNASVYIIKNGHHVSRQRHQRNVVSAMGHFVTFAISMLETFLLVHAFYFITNVETLTNVRNLSMFFIPSIKFFVYPFIETMFSENLRDSFCRSPKTWYAQIDL